MIDLKPACHELVGVLTRVTDRQLTQRTPCAEYNVADLVTHINEVAQGFAAVAGDGPGEEPTRVGPRDDPRWRDRVPAHVRQLGTAWDDEGAWQGSADASGALVLSNELWGRIALTEAVVHCWDLATATGQRLALPDDTLQACLDHVTEFVPNAPLPELWGPPVQVPADAPLLDRVVAVTGRRPR